MIERLQDFIDDGYSVVRSVVSESACRKLEAALASILPADGDLPTHGIRNLLSLSPAIRAQASEGPLQDLANSALGAPTRPVKAIYFDKLPGANWSVPWHQDLSIAVQRRVEIAGFVNWTTKAGVPHVQPPAAVLESIVTLRIHLDDCPAANGALRVIPGSHNSGRLDAEQIQAQRKERSEVVCEAKRGDVLVMSPLILHASPRAEVPRHRRVVHVECSSQPLPVPLRWHN